MTPQALIGKMSLILELRSYKMKLTMHAEEKNDDHEVEVLISGTEEGKKIFGILYW